MNRRQANRWCALAVAVVGGLVFCNSLENGLVMDGRGLLVDNPSPPTDPFDLAGIFLAPYKRPPEYRPLTSWSLAWVSWVNVSLGQEAAQPFLQHLLNVVLHSGVSALIYLLLLELGLRRAGALGGAFLFAVHPVHTEVVAGVVGRSELLAAGFGALLLIAHRRRWGVPVCLTLYALALLGKESAIGFAVVAAACDLLLRPRGPGPRRSMVRWVGYLLVCVGWFVLRGVALSDPLARTLTSDAEKNPTLVASGGERVLTALRVQLDYLLQELSPWPHLAAEYAFDQIPRVDTPADPHVLGFTALLLFAVAAAWRLRRSVPQVGLAIFAYAVLFAPTSNILLPIGTIRADRLAYAPSIMVCLLLGLAFQALRAWRPREALVALCLVLACWTARSAERERVWHDEEVFYAALVLDSPRDRGARLHQARRLYVEKDYLGALTHLNAADAIQPLSEVMDLVVLGESSRCVERWEEAAAAYRRALRASPRVEVAYVGLTIALLETGRWDEAGEVAEGARQAYPERPRLYRTLRGWIHDKQRPGDSPR